jgi:hypothetical protein
VVGPVPVLPSVHDIPQCLLPRRVACRGSVTPQQREVAAGAQPAPDLGRDDVAGESVERVPDGDEVERTGRRLSSSTGAGGGRYASYHSAVP